MAFNNILIKTNIDISNGHTNSVIELIYGNDKFYYKQNSLNYVLMTLNLEKFIDKLCWYEFICIGDISNDIILSIFNKEYSLYKTRLITDFIPIKKNNQIMLSAEKTKNINFDIKIMLKKHLKKDNIVSYDIYNNLNSYVNINSYFIRNLDGGTYNRITIPYIIILYGKNLEIIKNISSLDGTVYKLYKINNTVLIQLKKLVMYGNLFFHHKQIHKKIHKIDRFLLTEFEELRIIKNMVDIDISDKIHDILKIKSFNDDMTGIILSTCVSGDIEKQIAVKYKIYKHDKN